MTLKVSLDQWQALVSVVEFGSYAAAADALDKSQSTITYAIQKIEAELDVRLFELNGRKAELTAAGETLHRRACVLVGEAKTLERTSRHLRDTQKAELTLAVDEIFPRQPLFAALDKFCEEYPFTRIEILESVLSGPGQSLLEQQADLAITGLMLTGYSCDLLHNVTLIPVASVEHPLNNMSSPVSLQNLSQYRQLVVRDGVTHNRRDAGWLGAEQRWTVTNIYTSIQAVVDGYGFAWLPFNKVANLVDRGVLQQIELDGGMIREIPTYLAYSETGVAHPVVQRMGELLLECSTEYSDGSENFCPTDIGPILLS